MEDREKSLQTSAGEADGMVIPEDWTDQSMPTLAGRAASFMALIGVVEILVFLMIGGLLMYVAVQPEEEFFEAIRELPNGEQVNLGNAAQVKESAWLMVIALATLLAVPGIAFLVLGRGVRRVGRTSIYYTQLILLTQIMVLGVVVLVGVIQAIMQGNPVGLTLTIVFMGTPLAIMIYIMRMLMTLRGLMHSFERPTND